jgi:DNA mismatch endonuclease (patch repair protein)
VVGGEPQRDCQRAHQKGLLLTDDAAAAKVVQLYCRDSASRAAWLCRLPPIDPMADRLSRERRSWNMSRIRGRDTTPEREVRSILHSIGCRFRLHVTSLPGRPDVVLARHRTVVVVHGCYWHRHAKCRYAYTPKSNLAFWTTKFAENVERDRRTAIALRRLGWRVVTVWECELRKPVKLRSRLARLLGIGVLPTR